MRILVLSNYYPPHVQGGYELRCSETAAELVKRGHEVAVLTSRDNTRPTKTRLDGVEVHYGLHLEADPRPLRTALRFFLRRKRNEIGNQLLVEDVIAELRPDIVFIWGMWNVPRCVPYMAERLCPGRVVYHLSDYWSALPSAYCQYWEKSSGRRLSALPKRLIARPVLARLAQAEELHLRFQHPTCVSQAVKDNLVKAGVPIAHAAVLHSGIDVDQFRNIARTPINLGDENMLRLVYAGRLTSDKGVHTAIEAVARLVQESRTNVHLDIIGDGDSNYITMLKRLAGGQGTPLPVRFLAKVDRGQMPGILAHYDVLVFPSKWDEPFARVVIEAMAVGLVVIGTRTGGTAEVLIDGETGLVFPADDSVALANAIERLMNDRALWELLASAGRQAVLNNFTRAHMVDRFERYLQHVVAHDQPVPGGMAQS
ncbi:MAG: glycosyltransferase family 4 protein [Anaerolineae bacterium]|nr:glycosyltransferase family 4 protein [Anaerolineae bacterium]